MEKTGFYNKDIRRQQKNKMVYAVIVKEKGKIRLASTQGYRTKRQAEQIKRIYQRTNKDKKIKFYVRKVS